MIKDVIIFLVFVFIGIPILVNLYIYIISPILMWITIRPIEIVEEMIEKGRKNKKEEIGEIEFCVGDKAVIVRGKKIKDIQIIDNNVKN